MKHVFVRKSKFIYTCLGGFLAVAFAIMTNVTEADAAEAAGSSYVQELEQTIEEVLQWQCEEYHVTDTQTLLNEVYAAEAQNGVTQTYVMALCGKESMESPYDYTDYAQGLQTVLENAEEPDPATLQKSATLLYLLGADNPAQERALNETIGKKGIMSYVYGLLMLDAGAVQSDVITREEILQIILETQLPDGGFALMGECGDIDVTAMTLQALAPYYLKDAAVVHEVSEECLESVRVCVEKALAFLASCQQTDGNFLGVYGTSAESTAQTIVALHALHIDVLTDEAFIKEGNTAYDGLMLYKTAEGGFAHTAGGMVNDMATAQALQALSVLWQQETGENIKVYSGNMKQGMDYRVMLTAVVLLVAVCYLLWSCIQKRMNKKRLISIGAIAALLIAGVWFIQIQTKEAYRADSGNNEDTEEMAVYVEIRCDAVAGRENYIPEDGVILAQVQVDVKEDASAFEALEEACRQYDIQLEYQGGAVSKGFAYVEGIAYVYEYDFGDLSGWMYLVNDEKPGVGSGEYRLEEGDRVLWIYTTNIGKDVGVE